MQHKEASLSLQRAAVTHECKVKAGQLQNGDSAINSFRMIHHLQVTSLRPKECLTSLLDQAVQRHQVLMGHLQGAKTSSFPIDSGTVHLLHLETHSGL